MSFARYVESKPIDWENYPESQKLAVDISDLYRFERVRLGERAVTTGYHTFGKYLYRNQRNGVLIASFEKPTGQETYRGDEVGMLSDSMVYYKTH